MKEKEQKSVKMTTEVTRQEKLSHDVMSPSLRLLHYEILCDVGTLLGTEKGRNFFETK
jgi:hypothetical protein